MKTTIDYLFRVEPPWVFIGFAEPERRNWIPQYYFSGADSNMCVRRLRGKKMKTTAALMDEFGAALQFFMGFGENWWALGDCLSCLDEWLPATAYVLVVEDTEEVLRDEQPDQMVALLKTLHEAGEWWAKPITDNGPYNRNAIPFHVLLNVTDGFSLDVDRIARLADGSSVPVRRGGPNSIKICMDNSTEMYSKVAQDIISDWRSRSFTSLTNLTPIRSSLVYGEEVKLDQHQTDSLLKTVGAWFLAYSAGTESSYLGFRLPEGVEWDWTPKAMDALSSYFVRGTVFKSDELLDNWYKKYGHPDRLDSFILYSDDWPKWSPKKREEVRQNYIRDFGPGVVNPKIPTTAIDQWKQIAFDSSGETWFGGYWTGYSLKDTQIQIYRTNSLPTPLDRRNFGADFKSRSFGVDAGFENLGIAPLHAKSLIQWKLSYGDILQKTGNLLIADVKTLINQSPPESPRPMLLRLVFREDKMRWVPYEIVQGNLRDTHRQYAFW